jgi:alanine racemase
MPDRLTIAAINLQNYTHNIATIRKLLPDGVQIMAVVKANAYGHGIERMAAAAVGAGTSCLGVVSLGELKKVRAAGVTAPVLILNYLDTDSMPDAFAHQGTITLMDADGVVAAQAAAETQDGPAKVHIKVDTGMHRAGCNPKELVSLAQQVRAASRLELEGVFTHFAESEASDDTFTRQQLAVFGDCLEQLKAAGITPPLIHAANSAATIAVPEAHFSMVRPGLVTYGLNPFEPGHPKYSFVQENLKPVLSLKTQVVFIRTIEPGETVGYNRRWRASRRSTLALLPVGYGDGFRRSPQNADKVLVAGKYAPIVGSVSMDQTVVDITDIEGVQTGDEVVLLGEQVGKAITAGDIAGAYGTINYEVVTALAERVSREYLD